MAKNKNWILLRGLIRGSFHWHRFPALLAEAFPEDKIHLFDLPGNGLRHLEDSPTTIQDYTDDIRFLARHLDNIHIIAVSLGGMVTLEWLSYYPKEVASAFVINTSLGDTGPFYKRLNYLNYPNIAKSFLADISTREKLILDITANNLKVHNEVLENNITMAQKYPVSRRNFFRQLIAGKKTRYNPLLENYKNIYFMTSANDRLVHCENTFNLCRKLNIEPIIHPWAGHDLTLDDPEFVVQKCQALLLP